ncbi:hypothetical protein QTO34_011196 [Cnephaeus nilssonii]|uniref:Uncharacterized protein n=1 Tax=Cnephaeus nilssonii TaxID=3371016 RepID=A0AA40LDS4_CNENI|nr:hypothetical protein QTO34_011196 [Eptesicus nilssonii]
MSSHLRHRHRALDGTISFWAQHNQTSDRKDQASDSEGHLRFRTPRLIPWAVRIELKGRQQSQHEQSPTANRHIGHWTWTISFWAQHNQTSGPSKQSGPATAKDSLRFRDFLSRTPRLIHGQSGSTQEEDNIQHEHHLTATDIGHWTWTISFWAQHNQTSGTQ